MPHNCGILLNVNHLHTKLINHKFLIINVVILLNIFIIISLTYRIIFNPIASIRNTPTLYETHLPKVR